MSWVEFGKDAKSSSSVDTRLLIFYVALGAMVPIFSVLGHLRRASQLYAIAAMAGFLAMIILVESTNSYIFLSHDGSSSRLMHLPVRIAGMILQMVGIVRKALISLSFLI